MEAWPGLNRAISFELAAGHAVRSGVIGALVWMSEAKALNGPSRLRPRPFSIDRVVNPAAPA